MKDYRACKLAVNLLKNALCHYSGKVFGRSFLLEMQTHVIFFYAATTGPSFSPFLYIKCNSFVLLHTKLMLHLHLSNSVVDMWPEPVFR